MRCITAWAPGKLVILGEYAVLTGGEPGVVAAVDRGVRVDLFPQRPGCSRARTDAWWTPTLGAQQPRPGGVVDAALQTVTSYLQTMGMALSPFSLSIRSDLDRRHGKYGLGSSAAVAVAVVAAVLASAAPQALEGDRLVLFKLAAQAHFGAQGGGSGIDVAAAVYGGWTWYASPGPAWMTSAATAPPSMVVGGAWPHLDIRGLSAPAADHLLVGFSGTSITTGPRVARVQGWQSAHPAAFRRFLRRSRTTVQSFVQHWEGGQVEASIANLASSRRLLCALGDDVGLVMEGPAARRMHHLAARQGGVAKPSGAGGGDCSVALLPNRGAWAAVMESWTAAGIAVLNWGVGGPGAQWGAL